MKRMERAASIEAVAGENGTTQERACKRGCKARCCGRQSCSNCRLWSCPETLPDLPTQCPVDANPVGPDVAALCLARVCACKGRHRGCAHMRSTPCACAPDAEDFGRAGSVRAGSGQAPSGQQCALWCSCDLVGTARARSLTAWEMVEHAWYEFTGGWTAVCDQFGSCWPCWAPGEDLERLPARGSECGYGFSCSYCCTVCPRVVTLSASAGNDVDTCSTTPGREGAAEVTPDFNILTPPAPQPDYRPQRLPPPRLQDELGCASVGCTRRMQALRPNRAQRREAQWQQRRTRRWASCSERRRTASQHRRPSRNGPG